MQVPTDGNLDATYGCVPRVISLIVQKFFLLFSKKEGFL